MKGLAAGTRNEYNFEFDWWIAKKLRLRQLLSLSQQIFEEMRRKRPVIKIISQQFGELQRSSTQTSSEMFQSQSLRWSDNEVKLKHDLKQP